ncbi:TIGR03915 family putative DNA repair protein [Pedobacter immunditicola]|uniref:TIGR03915 family putative DNA repair protein n=1 Tax=Pedobacter immunditicola TaxID=3133440 RepID=UPI0030B228B8
MIYVFDGSLEGLLCAVYEWFERKPGKIRLVTTALYQSEAFTEIFQVLSDNQKADRVWKGLQKKLDKGWMRRYYCCYLSEQAEAYTHLFELSCNLFKEADGAENNYGDPHVLAVAQFAKKVEREKHRMEAFIRFQQTADGYFYCGIDPDFNVLPLIMGHFKARYADQQWIIYDLKRNYGLHYDLDQVKEIQVPAEDRHRFKKPGAGSLSEEETHYGNLWKDYFKSTNIAVRKNTKLHVQHVPRRYWKYLTEKQ